MLAAVLMMAVFFMPFTVYANDDSDGTVGVDEDYADNIHISIDDIDMDELSDMDIADIMKLLEFFSMFGEMDVDEPEPVSESAIPYSPKPFTPDGQATVIDWATEYDGKEFYTFKTPAGNVFYLIIDNARGSDNVYFLNAVTEQDLIALAEKAGEKITASTSSIPTPDPKEPENPDKPGENPGEPEKPPKQKSNTGMIIFLLIGVAAAGGIGFYVKIIRPKQQAGMDDDEDDDIPGDDDGGEMVFENEPEEADGDGEE